MNPQETIYTLLAVEGDVFHKVIRENWGDGYGGIVYKVQCSCKLLFYRDEFKEHLKLNPDFTTEAGAFWLLKRLPEWDRYKEFCNGIWYTNGDFLHVEENEASAYVISRVLIWLITDAKDGKAPALFNALCEFTGVKVEGTP